MDLPSSGSLRIWSRISDRNYRAKVNINFVNDIYLLLWNQNMQGMTGSDTELKTNITQTWRHVPWQISYSLEFACYMTVRHINIVTYRHGKHPVATRTDDEPLPGIFHTMTSRTAGDVLMRAAVAVHTMTSRTTIVSNKSHGDVTKQQERPTDDSHCHWPHNDVIIQVKLPYHNIHGKASLQLCSRSRSNAHCRAASHTMQAVILLSPFKPVMNHPTRQHRPDSLTGNRELQSLNHGTRTAVSVSMMWRESHDRRRFNFEKLQFVVNMWRQQLETRVHRIPCAFICHFRPMEA